MVGHEQDRARAPLLLKAEEAAKVLSIPPTMVRKLAAGEARGGRRRLSRLVGLCFAALFPALMNEYPNR